MATQFPVVHVCECNAKVGELRFSAFALIIVVAVLKINEHCFKKKHIYICLSNKEDGELSLGPRILLVYIFKVLI